MPDTESTKVIARDLTHKYNLSNKFYYLIKKLVIPSLCKALLSFQLQGYLNHIVPKKNNNTFKILNQCGSNLHKIYDYIFMKHSK